MKPRLRLIYSARLNAPRGPCWRCGGKRVIVVDSWPTAKLTKCPACNGHNPISGKQRASTSAPVDARRAA